MTATDDEDEDVDEAGCGERAAAAVVRLCRLRDSSPPTPGILYFVFFIAACEKCVFSAVDYLNVCTPVAHGTLVFLIQRT